VQFNTAFLLTLPPNSRTAAPEAEKKMREVYDPSTKEGPGRLTQFREGMFGRLFYKHLGKDAEITPLAVQDWRYEQRSYKIYRTYRIKTKEVEMDIMLPVFSVEPESAGQGRKWFVNMREFYPIKDSKRLTRLGEGVGDLRQQASEWLIKEVAKLDESSPFGDFKAVDKTPWDLLPTEDPKGSDRRALVRQAFSGGEKQRLYQFQLFTRADEPGKWEHDEGKIRIYLFFNCTMPRAPGEPPAYKIEGVAAVESKQVIDPATFDGNSPRPDWNLVSVVFSGVMPLAERKGGPGGPPG
jgi:hypothetical protein